MKSIWCNLLIVLILIENLEELSLFENEITDITPLKTLKNDKDNRKIHNPIGALSGFAVCDGYAETLSILLNMAGIESRIIKEDSLGENGWEKHAWNMVKIDGAYYHLDSTWNDLFIENQDSYLHTYFNISDRQISADHIINQKKYPISPNDNNNLIGSDIEKRGVQNNIIVFRQNEEIYIKTPETDKAIKLCEDTAQYLCTDGQYAYYSNVDDNYKLYKIKLDGTEKIKLAEEEASYIFVKDDYIYYLGSIANQSTKMYKISKNGSIKTILVNTTAISSMLLKDEWFYYKSYDFDFNKAYLYKININGFYQTTIIKDGLPGFTKEGPSVSFSFLQDFFILDDFIYYSNADDGNSLYKIKTDGSQRTKINNDNSQIIELVGNFIYYNVNKNIYKIKNDGTIR